MKDVNEVSFAFGYKYCLGCEEEWAEVLLVSIDLNCSMFVLEFF